MIKLDKKLVPQRFKIILRYRGNRISELKEVFYVSGI